MSRRKTAVKLLKQKILEKICSYVSLKRRPKKYFESLLLPTAVSGSFAVSISANDDKSSKKSVEKIFYDAVSKFGLK
jgi:hypothetical protein